MVSPVVLHRLVFWLLSPVFFFSWPDEGPVGVATGNECLVDVDVSFCFPPSWNGCSQPSDVRS